MPRREGSGLKAYLREVHDEMVVGGGAGDVEGDKRPKALIGVVGPHELLA
jgi:hypothetical protein